MSAISALWIRKKELSAPVLHEKMLAAQTAYGPDRRYSWNDGNIALGGNLMRLLPEDSFDEQPIWNQDRSACLIADVRLDNRAELVRSLALVHPEQLADASILLSCWDRWGSACLDHIVGGFAFAVWSPRRQELFAARDHIGERPLFFHRGDDFFALASMPKGLLALPGVFQGFEESRVAGWLACVHPDWTKSFFKGAERVPLGHLLRVTPDSFTCKPYWHPAQAKPTRYVRDEEYAEALFDLLNRATEARLRSTKAIGTQLSAGLDSASVTACAAQLLARRGQRITAFTSVPRADFNGVSQPWQLASEGAGAADVARRFPNLDHVLVDTKGGDLFASMRAWTDAMDEPALNVVNLLWIARILEQAKQRGIGVMLEGVSGNGTISYETPNILSHFFNRGRWVKLFSTARSLRSKGDISGRAALAYALKDVLSPTLKRKLIPVPGSISFDLAAVNPELARKHDLFHRVSEKLREDYPGLTTEHSRLFERFDFGPLHAAVQAVSGIDPRDPTSDKRIYEFCFSIPPEQFVVGGDSRSLVRRAMRGRLPESTLSRYKRGHQGADWNLPMEEALPAFRQELDLLEKSPIARETLDLPRMRTLLDTWPTADFHTRAVDDLWHMALSRGLSLGYFLQSRTASDSGSEATASTEGQSGAAAPAIATDTSSSNSA